MSIFDISQDKYGKFCYIFGNMDSVKKDIKIIVGKNLKAARLAKGLTQKQLAAEMFKNQCDYSDYETGKIELDYEKIVFLCKRLDITPNDLFDIE
ncbi:MAG: helix-turn-helix transcriptional regulator [Clostridiales bacterium]|nr:helix-turn-helix transcriptional regulator [Clostridiales bacterium]